MVTISLQMQPLSSLRKATKGISCPPPLNPILSWSHESAFIFEARSQQRKRKPECRK